MIRRKGTMRRNFVILLLCLCAGAASTQSDEPPVRVMGRTLSNPARPDGGLRLVAGVQDYEVFRATRLHPELSDGRGWTYNHAQMITYWKGLFHAEFINSPMDKHGWPTPAVFCLDDFRTQKQL
jgi:hypothetical protein